MSELTQEQIDAMLRGEDLRINTEEDKVQGLVNAAQAEKERGSAQPTEAPAMVDKSLGGDLLDRIVMIRRQCAIDLGVVIPSIRLRDNVRLNTNEYVLKIQGEEVARGEVMPDHYLAINSDGVEETISGIETVEPTFGLPALWITKKQRDNAELLGYTTIDPPSVITTHLIEVIKSHEQGYAYPTTENGSTTVKAGNFFDVPDDDYSQITGGNFSLSAAVKDSVWNIAASGEPIDLSASSTNASNSDIAEQLYELVSGGTFNSTLNTFVGSLSIASDTTKGLLNTSQSMLSSVSTQRTSLSGVSLDEETTNLIMFQQSYSVASRMVTTIDEMLNTLINSTGRVGL